MYSINFLKLDFISILNNITNIHGEIANRTRKYLNIFIGPGISMNNEMYVSFDVNFPNIFLLLGIFLNKI